MMNASQLIAKIRSHAIAHYNEGGWDYVVEAYEDRDILVRALDLFDSTFFMEESEVDTLLANITVMPELEVALRNVRRCITILDDHRREIASTAF